MTVELKNILDLEKWEKLQESLALSTRLAIILVDYKGRPVTKHSQVQPFCQLVRHSPEPVSYTHLDVYKRQLLRCLKSKTNSWPETAT